MSESLPQRLRGYCRSSAGRCRTFTGRRWQQ